MARKIRLLGALLLALLPRYGAAADVQRFHLSQAAVQLPGVKAYVDIRDPDGNAVSDLQSNHLNATLGGRFLKVGSLTSFDKTGEGVAYVFVIDTSESITPARFDSIRAAIESWVKSADAKDRVALVEFAEAVHVLSDFSDGKEKTLAAAHTLARHGKRSLVHQALVDAVELSARRDADLPTRRAIVIVTDGKDEGSGLTSDDVLERASAAHIPIYAIGFSNLAAGERRQYLDDLHRIAEKSGGDYSEPEANGLSAGFTAMKKTIRGVSVATLTCADCPADSKKVRLEMQLESGSRVFSDAFDVLAVPAPAPPNPTPVKAPWWKRPWWVYATAGASLLLIVTGLLIWRRNRRKAAKELAAEQAFVEPERSSTDFDLPAYGSTRPVSPAPNPTGPAGPSVLVRLTVVRGKGPGTVSELRMPVPAGGSASPDGSGARLVIGRRSLCDLSLSDDETVSGEHCELFWANRKLVIRDLRSSNGTLVNGIPIVGDQPLEDGDRVGIGQTEYRVGVIPASV